MKRRWLRFSLFWLLLVVMFGVGCGQASPQSSQAPARDQAAQSEGGRAVGAPAPPAAAPAAQGAAQSTAANKQAAPTDGGQRLIVKNGTLSLVVEDVPLVATRARTLAETFGGYLVSSAQREESGRPAATVTIRVPAERFEEAMEQLKGMAVRTQNEQVTARDVTEEFVDNDARLRTLRAQETRYLELLGQARTVEDILKIEQQLTNVRTQIEQLQGRQQFLQRSAETSSITVELRLPASAQTPPPSDWAVQPIFRNAVSALVATLQLLLGFLIFAAVFSPIWVPLVLLIRWWRGRRRARRAVAAVPAPVSPPVST